MKMWMALKRMDTVAIIESRLRGSVGEHTIH